MNVKQKGALWLGIAVFCAAGLYPPWVQPMPETTQPVVRAVGRAWLFGSPTELEVAACSALEPDWEGSMYERFAPGFPQALRDSLERWQACVDSAAASATLQPVTFARIDIRRLAVEWILVSVVTAGLVLTLGGAPAGGERHANESLS